MFAVAFGAAGGHSAPIAAVVALEALALAGAGADLAGRRMAPISFAPRLLVMKISAREKSTRRLSPRVRVALSRIPRSRFHNESLAFSISSKRTKLN